MHLTRTLCTPTVCQTLGYSMLGKQILQKNVTRDICVLKKTNDEIGEEGIHKEFLQKGWSQRQKEHWSDGVPDTCGGKISRRLHSVTRMGESALNLAARHGWIIRRKDLQKPGAGC